MAANRDMCAVVDAAVGSQSLAFTGGLSVWWVRRRVIHWRSSPSISKCSTLSDGHSDGASVTRTNRGQYSLASRATCQKSNALTT